jgi:hypothetical protein
MLLDIWIVYGGSNCGVEDGSAHLGVPQPSNFAGRCWADVVTDVTPELQGSC